MCEVCFYTMSSRGSKVDVFCGDGERHEYFTRYQTSQSSTKFSSCARKKNLGLRAYRYTTLVNGLWIYNGNFHARALK